MKYNMVAEFFFELKPVTEPEQQFLFSDRTDFSLFCKPKTDNRS